MDHPAGVIPRGLPGEAWAVLAMLGYVGQGICLRFAVTGAHPAPIVGLYLLPAWATSLFYWFCERRRGEGWPDGSGRLAALVGLGGIFNYLIGNAVYLPAMKAGGLAIASPSAYSLGLWGSVWGLFLVGEPIGLFRYAGMGVYGSGLLVLAYARAGLVGLPTGWGIAVPLGLAAGASWALGSATTRLALVRGVPRMAALATAITAAQFVTWPTVWLFGLWPEGNSWWFLLPVAVAGVCNLGAQSAVMLALSRAPVGRVNLVQSAPAALLPVAGYYLFTEPLTALMIGGIFLVLAGIAIGQIGRRPQASGPRPAAQYPEVCDVYQHVTVSQVENIAIVTINRPEVLNAMNAQTRGDIAKALRAAQADPAVRAVILTGGGERAFSAGQDLNESQELTEEQARAWMADWADQYTAFREMEKPLVAAINGIATGAGFQLTLLCDIRVAASHARFGLAEINVGLPTITGHWLIDAYVGPARAQELIMTGRMWSVDEAREAGVISRVVPAAELMDAALALARELAAKPAVGMALNKRRWREVTEAAFQEAEAAGARYQTEAIRSGEPRKVMQAFLEERRRRRDAAAQR